MRGVRSPDLLLGSAFVRIAVGIFRAGGRGGDGGEPSAALRPVKAPAAVAGERAAVGGYHRARDAGHLQTREIDR